MFSFDSFRSGTETGRRGVQAALRGRTASLARDFHTKRARRGRASDRRQLAIHGVRWDASRHPPQGPDMWSGAVDARLAGREDPFLVDVVQQRFGHADITRGVSESIAAGRGAVITRWEAERLVGADRDIVVRRRARQSHVRAFPSVDHIQ